MRHLARATIGALMLAGATFAMSSSASAHPGIEFGFGGPNFVFGDPCDYYDYYDAAPPWGLPPDYCEYPVYFEPVYFDGSWYRGPIYYRWTHGRRLFWLHGGWHEDAWRGPRPASIDWRSRGGANHGFRPGVHVGGSVRRGAGPRPWGGSNQGNRDDRFWTGNGNHGGGGSHFGGGNHGNFGGHGSH